MYVHLDVGWMSHPFSFNNFLITEPHQIKTILGLGLKTVRWDTTRSQIKKDAETAPVAEEAPDVSEPEAQPSQDVLGEMEEKSARMARHRQHKAAYPGVSKAFFETSKIISGINRNIFARPTETVDEANALVTGLTNSIFSGTDVVLQVMQEIPSGDEGRFHSLNVSILSMMVGKALGVPEGVCKEIGVAGLFHDIGLVDIPSQILKKDTPLSRAEQAVRQMHVERGAALAKKIGLSHIVQTVIAQHHEYSDGSGYPNALKGDAISPVSGIIIAVNHYDNLCNNPIPSASLTPHEALSQMFAVHKGKFNPKVIQVLVKTLGVYPPGTLVSLSNNMIGVVTNINTSSPLRPVVLIYDEFSTPEDAAIIDLMEEPSITIKSAMRQNALPRQVVDFLCPQKRISYYFNACKDEAKHAG